MLELSWSFVLCNFKLLFAVLHRVVFPSVSVHVAHIYACMDCCLIRATRGVVISFDAACVLGCSMAGWIGSSSSSKPTQMYRR